MWRQTTWLLFTRRSRSGWKYSSIFTKPSTECESSSFEISTGSGLRSLNLLGLRRIHVRGTQATLAASHSTTAPQKPRRRQTFGDGVSRTAVARKRSAFASHEPRSSPLDPRQPHTIRVAAAQSAVAPFFSATAPHAPQRQKRIAVAHS